MVLYKRKPVVFHKPVIYPPDDTQVWYISLTNEYFENYDDYLARMDYYNERKFICELTGHSCLTYFEAIESEKVEADQIIGSFPEPLKEPILRKVQFSQTSRLDTLVDDLYNSLRQDFYPGETVIAKSNEQRIKVIIREKAKFNAITLPSGEVRPGYSRYRVEFVSDPTQEMAVDDTQLTRDRRLFTKVILRTFIKHAVSRESWSGAPWLVKTKYADKYRIDSEIPPELLKQSPHYQQMIERNKKQEARQRAREEKAKELAELKQRNLELKLEKKAQILKNQQLKIEQRAKKGDIEPRAWILPEQANFQFPDGHNLSPIQPSIIHNDTVLPSISSVVGNSIASGNNSPLQVPLMNVVPPIPTGTFSHPVTTAGTGNITTANTTPAPSTSHKKQLIQDDLLFIPTADAPVKSIFNKENVLPEDHSHLLSTLLESWLFLNVYHEPLLIDPFTYDDYVDVLRFADEDSEIPLLNEIHCALLSAIVGTRNNDLLISMPYYDQEKDKDEEEKEEKEEKEDKDEKDENEDDGRENDKEVEEKDEDEDVNNNDKMDVDKSDSDDTSHRANYFVRYQNVDWKERLKKRMFKDGGWQQITISILHSVAYVPEWTDIINEILSFMASPERGITLQAARAGYYELSFVLRIRVLEILCHLVFSSSVIRSHIDKCLETSTKFRKEKMDRQREAKLLVETLKALESEKKNLIAEEIASQRKEGEGEDVNISIDEAEFAKKNPEFNKSYQECERITTTIEEYADLNRKCEEELIRLDCQRLRLLGKDRFYNRYWWFESNGMKRPEKLEVEGKEKGVKRGGVKKELKEEQGVTDVKKEEDAKKEEVKEEEEQGKVQVKKEEEESRDDTENKEEEEEEASKLEEEEGKDEVEGEEEEEGEKSKAKTKGKSKGSRPKGRPPSKGKKPVSKNVKTRSKKKKEPTPEEDEDANESEDEVEPTEINSKKVQSQHDSDMNETEDELDESDGTEQEAEIDHKSESNSKSVSNETTYDSDEEEEEEEEPVGYAMGRLWIQGPTEEDARVYLLKDQSRLLNQDSISNNFVPTFPSATVDEPTPYDLKQKVEQPTFLSSDNDWGYYDKPEEISSLMQWLNPHGKRESKLLKELVNIKLYLLGSMHARMEDIEADKQSSLHEIQETIDEEFGIISDDEEESKDEQNGNGEPISAPVESKEESPEILEEDSSIVGRRRLRSRVSDTTGPSDRKKGPGRPTKKIALDKEAIARERQKHLEKKKLLREQKEDRREELISQLSSKVPSRVLNWTNSIVEQEIGHSHYEGPAKKRGPRKPVNVHKEWTNQKEKRR